MSQGKIKTIVADKGFGFITPEGKGKQKDLFFHCSELQNAEFDALEVGDFVTFDLGTSEKGPRAENIRVER